MDAAQWIFGGHASAVAEGSRDELTAAIRSPPDEPDAGSAGWSVRLHALVDELDALEPAFTGYDRLRVGGPTSRDTCVDAMRARHPRRVAVTGPGPLR